MSKRDFEKRDDYDDGERKRQKTNDNHNEPSPDLHSIFFGEVASVQKYGVFVKIPGYKKQGLVHISQMSKSRIEDPSEMLAKGESVYCKIINIEDNKIGLSMKTVNQTNGRDLDPNNVELSLDEKKRKQFFKKGKEVIELGAVLNTTCRRCGGHGHFAQDCFVVKGTKSYDLVPEFDETKIIPTSPEKDTTKKKKKEKKHKKEKKKKKKKSVSSDSDSDSNSKHKSKHKKKHKRKYSSSSSDS